MPHVLDVGRYSVIAQKPGRIISQTSPSLEAALDAARKLALVGYVVQITDIKEGDLNVRISAEFAA